MIDNKKGGGLKHTPLTWKSSNNFIGETNAS